MSVGMRDAMMRRLGDLCHEPLDTWIRATIGDWVVVDSTCVLRHVPSPSLRFIDGAGIRSTGRSPQPTGRPGDRSHAR